MWWTVDHRWALLNFSAKLMQLFQLSGAADANGIFPGYADADFAGLVILLAYYGHHMQVLLRGVR